MRQRAAAYATTPPRSADSDHGQWPNQSRMRSSYHQTQTVREESMDNMYGAPSRSVDSNNSVMEGHGYAARRRRTSTHSQNKDGQQQPQQQPQPQLKHSPQHYLAEYNKNYGAAADADNAPHSTGSVRSYSRGHSQSSMGYNAAASDVYHAQYGNHYFSHQHGSSNSNHVDPQRPPILQRNNSTGDHGGGFPRNRMNAHKASFQHFEASFHLDPNPIAALHFRKALHVPDKDYGEYINGYGRVTTPILNPVCCANVCAGFSCVGFIFLVFVGILLDTQPLFIQGTLPSAIKENDNGKATTIYFVTAERLPMASSAYQASYAYLLTAIVCLIYVYYERLDLMVKRRAYQDVPDAATPTSTAGIADGDYYNVDEGGSTSIVMGADSSAYPPSAWNRLVSASMIQAREWAGAAATRVWNGRARRTTRNKRNKASAKTV